MLPIHSNRLLLAIACGLLAAAACSDGESGGGGDGEGGGGAGACDADHQPCSQLEDCEPLSCQCEGMRFPATIQACRSFCCPATCAEACGEPGGSGGGGGAGGAGGLITGGEGGGGAGGGGGGGGTGGAGAAGGGGGAGGGVRGGIGDPCCADSDCGSGICKTEFMELGRSLPMPGGTCTQYCSVSTDCADDEFCHQQTDDGAVVRGAYCLKRCASDAECRPGYHCGGWGDCFPGGSSGGCGDATDLASVATVEPDGTLRAVGCTAGLTRSLTGSCGGPGSEAVYTYTADAGGTLELTTDDPATGTDTVLHVRSECAVAGAELACDDDGGGGGGASRVSVRVAAGTTVYVIVDTKTYGAFGLRATFTRGIDCPAGRADCDGDPSNACETELATSLSSCGACGAACERPNATTTCSAGACTIASCAAGFDDCDGAPSNGCEADLESDMAHCGACGETCDLPNASEECRGGACELGSCYPAPWEDCDGDPTNGCETSLDTLTDCGACGRPCAPPHSTGACSSSGSCYATACDPGWDSCDGNAANGCEADLSADAAHCGACGNACSLPDAVPACAGGTCGLAGCNPGFDDCDGDPSNGCEVDLRADAAHCGACGNACPGAANAGPACGGGTCGFACTAPWGDCDGDPSNGCENDTRTDPLHCGACGAGCPGGPNAGPACAGGACALACDPGYGDCNGQAADGCELDLAVEPDHCGACGTACPRGPTADATCTGGTCGFTCIAPYADCDGAPGNLCEANLQSYDTDCGACGVSCGGNQRTCCAGVCMRGPCP